MSSEWKEVRLEEVTSILGDGLHGTPQYDEEGDYYFINGNNLNSGRIILTENTKRVNATEYNKYKKNLTDKTVLVSINGTLGNVALYNNEKVVLGKSACYFNVVEDVDKKFIYYVMTGSPFQSHIENLATGSTIKNVSLKLMRNFTFKLPPLDLQQEISSLLGILDDRITLLRETNKTLESIAQAIFKSWFVDFDPVYAKMEGRQPEGMDEATAALFPDSFEESELGLIPRGWNVNPIGNVIQTVGGGTPATKNPTYWSPETYHWTSPKDLSGLQAPVLLDTERRISAEGLKKISSGLLPKGTLLMSSRAPIGYLALAQIPLAINQGYIAILPEGQLTTSFMLFWCKQNMDAIKGRANGSTFMEISKKVFRQIPIITPTSAVMDAFDNTAHILLDRIFQNENTIRTLTELRDTLLPRLISGQLRLPEAQNILEETIS